MNYDSIYTAGIALALAGRLAAARNNFIDAIILAATADDARLAGRYLAALGGDPAPYSRHCR